MVTEMDRNFLNDNFLESEDWAFMNDSKMDDMPYFLKLDDGYTQYELECATLDPEVREDPWKDLSDGSDSGVDILSLKPEPLSPSSLSDAKAEPQSPSSVISDASSDSLFIGVPVQNNEMDIDCVTEISQEDWDSIQSVLFEHDTSGSTAVNASICDSSSSSADFEPVILTSDLASSIAYSPSSIDSLTLGGCKLPIQALRRSAVNNGTLCNPLSSKIKIQPKPLAFANSQVTSKRSAAAPTSRPVITVTLPALNNAHQSPVHLSNAVAASVGSSPAMLKAAKTPSDNTVLDVRALKRHQRMIKNRESACLSRKRKKDYVQSLEQQLYSYNADNERLKSENVSLKRKVEQLQTENERLKRLLPVSRVTGAGVTVLLCVVCLLSFNYFPILPSTPSNEGSLSAVRHSIHTGRSLLSLNSESAVNQHKNVPSLDSSEHRQLTQKSGLSLLQDVTDLMLSRRHEGSGFGSRFKCSPFFNSTESLRLVSELEGWVLSHEVELRRQQELIKMEKTKTKPKKKYYPPRRLKAAMNSNFQTNDLTANRYELQVFNGANKQYENFMEAINRRNDTFYVVSFRRDHLLLPATAHNSTMRPRMSVMMPAVSLNGTMQPPTGSIAMMQIDCEVTATRLIHIEKSAVPAEMLNRTVSVNEPNTHSSRDWPSPGRL